MLVEICLFNIKIPKDTTDISKNQTKQIFKHQIQKKLRKIHIKEIPIFEKQKLRIFC